jgi:P4 family phage/plasmid primase-like protien
MTAAIAYAAQGFPVFPCRPSKQPATRNGFKDATLDHDQIRTWWSDDPSYLIGVATGGGLLVVDLDEYKPGGVDEFLDALHAHLGQGGFPDTYETRTGQGGRHYWFTIAEPVSSMVGLFPNVDVRGEGGYIIAPPSVSTYGAYSVTNDVPIAPAPRWIVDEIGRQKTSVARQPFAVVKVDDMTAEDLARCNHYASTVFELEAARLRECSTKAVSSFGREPYIGPEWNATTFSVACNLIEIVNSGWNTLGESDAYELLTRTAPRDRGFDDADVLACWNSARKTVGESGRPMPTDKGVGLFMPFASLDPNGTDPSRFFVRGQGLDVLLLSAAVHDLGPLAIDSTENRGIWAYRSGVWTPSPTEVSNRCTVLLGAKFRPNHVANVLPMLQQQLTSSGSVIDCSPLSDWINLRNGMLHWKTGQLYPHDPSFLSTVQLPVSWDPSATCPAFDKFAGEVMASDAVSYLWEIIGYLVYSGNPLQRAFLLHGNGINGKGTLIRVLKALLGDRNVSEVTLTDIAEARFEVASLYGKIANLAGDIDASYMKSTARFKAITGEDTIRAERKFEHGFAFQNWAVPVFSANEFWKSSDTTVGYKRRWQLLPFPNSFSADGGQGLTESLCRELPGILVHAVSSLQDLMMRRDFDAPQSALDEKEKFEIAADQVSEWLRSDETVIVSDPKNLGVLYPTSESYKTYRRWSEDNGNSALPSSKWWQRMESLGYVWRKTGGRRHVVGLGVDQKATAPTWIRASGQDWGTGK